MVVGGIHLVEVPELANGDREAHGGTTDDSCLTKTINPCHTALYGKHDGGRYRFGQDDVLITAN